MRNTVSHVSDIVGFKLNYKFNSKTRICSYINADNRSMLEGKEKAISCEIFTKTMLQTCCADGGHDIGQGDWILRDVSMFVVLCSPSSAHTHTHKHIDTKQINKDVHTHTHRDD